MNRKNRLNLFLPAMGCLVFLAGCSSPADRAIKNLGGTKEEVEQAEAELTLMEPPPVDALSKALLREKDPKVLKRAAELLGRMASKTKDPQAIQGLAECLKSDVPAAIEACALGLGEAKSDEAYKALHALTLSKEEAPRLAAQKALEQKVSEIALEAQELAEKGEYEKAISQLEKALEIYPSSGEILTLLADASEAAGDSAKSEKWRNALATVKNWQVLAPLPPLGKDDFSKKLKKSFMEPTQEEITGLDDSPVSWQPTESTDANGYLSLTDLYAVPQASAILYTKFTIPPGSSNHVLSFRLKEKARIWVNESELFVSKKTLSDKWDEVRIPVPLRPTENIVRVQLGQEGAVWGIAMRVLNSDGSPLDGVKVTEE